MDLDMSTLKKCLGDYENREYRISELVELISSEKFVKRVTLHDVLFEMILKAYDVTEEQVKSSSRKREFVIARKAYSYLAIRHTLASNQVIGSKTNRDHK